MVKAFLNGLLNRNVAVAIQAVHPQSLDEAIQLAKREIKYSKCPENVDINNKCENIRAMQLSKITIQNLQDQILQLQQQVKRLEYLIKVNNAPAPRNSYAQIAAGQQNKQNKIDDVYNKLVFTPQHQQTRKYRNNGMQRPTNTGQNGITCFNCNKRGHMARNCMNPATCYRCGGLNHTSRNCLK